MLRGQSLESILRILLKKGKIVRAELPGIRARKTAADERLDALRTSPVKNWESIKTAIEKTLRIFKLPIKTLSLRFKPSRCIYRACLTCCANQASFYVSAMVGQLPLLI